MEIQKDLMIKSHLICVRRWFVKIEKGKDHHFLKNGSKIDNTTVSMHLTLILCIAAAGDHSGQVITT
jgi:hypothetical protein